jgi:hypothetical protein
MVWLDVITALPLTFMFIYFCGKEAIRLIKVKKITPDTRNPQMVGLFYLVFVLDFFRRSLANSFVAGRPISPRDPDAHIILKLLSNEPVRLVTALCLLLFFCLGIREPKWLDRLYTRLVNKFKGKSKHDDVDAPNRQ